MHVSSFYYSLWFDVFVTGVTREVAAGAPSSQPVAGTSTSEVSAAVPENEPQATIPMPDVSAAMAMSQKSNAEPVTSDYVQVTEIILRPMMGKILRPDLLLEKSEVVNFMLIWKVMSFNTRVNYFTTFKRGFKFKCRNGQCFKAKSIFSVIIYE